jgi:hypothetical protein
MTKHEYIIRKDIKEIYHNSEVISNEFIRELDQSEVDNLILNENIQICINYEEDYLEWVDKAENLKLFNSEIRNHINTESEYRGLDEFEHGYFLLAGLWKIKSGEKLLVLWYHH